MRVITYVEAELVPKQGDIDVYLLSIYDKSDRENISNQLIYQIVDEVQSELKQTAQENIEEE